MGNRVPFASLQTSPLVPGASPVKLFYRDEGQGTPLLFLHGGWGYEMYPFARQTKALRADYRTLIPDRGGYGHSTRLVADLTPDFHYHAAVETLSFLDSLGIERAFLWGHSDGAVIAAILGFTAPERVSGLILEAFHYYRVKPSSREFFETLAYRPEALGAELCERFAREFGVGYWRRFITTHARAWLQMADESVGPYDDPYAGRLRDITAPTLFIHGHLDPRTEPGELDAVSAQLPNAEWQVLDEGSHSPHSESATADLVTHLASEFLTSLHSYHYQEVPVVVKGERR
jgi:pimeloyl-ACP methyl ester carboxylesterase